MGKPEMQDYWRWKIVRQVSTFINEPDERNHQELLKMIEAYPSICRKFDSMERHPQVQPRAADFVCTVDN